MLLFLLLRVMFFSTSKSLIIRGYNASLNIHIRRSLKLPKHLVCLLLKMTNKQIILVRILSKNMLKVFFENLVKLSHKLGIINQDHKKKSQYYHNLKRSLNYNIFLSFFALKVRFLK